MTVSIAGKAAGSECSGDNVTECQCGTECLPWAPGGGSWHCLYSPPQVEGGECDYGQRKGPCEEDLNCTDGWCQGIFFSAKQTYIS